MCFFLQNLIQKEQQCGNPLFLIQSQDINLAVEDYDASRSEITVSLKPTDESWNIFGQNKDTVVVTSLLT